MSSSGLEAEVILWLQLLYEHSFSMDKQTQFTGNQWLSFVWIFPKSKHSHADHLGMPIKVLLSLVNELPHLATHDYNSYSTNDNVVRPPRG